MANRAKPMVTSAKPVAKSKVPEKPFGYHIDTRKNYEGRVKFLVFIYDPKDGTCFGRTPDMCVKYIIYVFVFLFVLAIMCYICMQALFATLSDIEPKYKLGDSLIGTSPAITYRPIKLINIESSTINVDCCVSQNNQNWINLIEKFLDPYKKVNGDLCNFETQKDPKSVCQVSVNGFGECSSKEGYGYQKIKPCVFLKINKIYGWVPECYNDTKDVPENMPKDLIAYIDSLKPEERQQIWLSCSGATKEDQQDMGEVTYSPNRGFPAYFYPYLNQPGYLSPLIAVQFKKLKYNKLVEVECRAWAKNIIHDSHIHISRASCFFTLFMNNPHFPNIPARCE